MALVQYDPNTLKVLYDPVLNKQHTFTPICTYCGSRFGAQTPRSLRVTFADITLCTNPPCDSVIYNINPNWSWVLQYAGDGGAFGACQWTPTGLPLTVSDRTSCGVIGTVTMGGSVYNVILMVYFAWSGGGPYVWMQHIFRSELIPNAGKCLQGSCINDYNCGRCVAEPFELGTGGVAVVEEIAY